MKRLLLKDVFAYLAADQDVEVDFAPAPAPLEPEEVDFAAEAVPDYYADVESSICIPGLLHIVHNASRDLSKAMLLFDDAIAKLKKVASLLGGIETRQRLIATCF